MGDTGYNADVQIALDTPETLPLARIQQAVDWVLSRHDQPAGTAVSVVIVDDARIRQMNRRFRNIDKPTDVLSFPAEPSPVDDDSEERYLGDLILGLPYIQRQAGAEKHAWQDELLLAVIHGTLHLLGYDHDSPEAQRTMWATQAEALAALGIPITVPLFEFGDADDPHTPTEDAPEGDE